LKSFQKNKKSFCKFLRFLVKYIPCLNQPKPRTTAYRVFSYASVNTHRAWGNTHQLWGNTHRAWGNIHRAWGNTHRAWGNVGALPRRCRRGPRRCRRGAEACGTLGTRGGGRGGVPLDESLGGVGVK